MTLDLVLWMGVAKNALEGVACRLAGRPNTRLHSNRYDAECHHGLGVLTCVEEALAAPRQNGGNISSPSLELGKRSGASR